MNRKWIFALAMCMYVSSFSLFCQSRPFDRFKSTTNFNSDSSDSSDDDDEGSAPSEESADDSYSPSNDDNGSFPLSV